MNRFNRTLTGLWVVCVGFLLLGDVSAAAGPSATAAVKETTKRLLTALESQRAVLERNPERIYDLVDEILVPHFDFRKITQAAVGRRHWGKASGDQRQALTEGFQQLLIRTYAKALLNYSGQKIRYLSERPGCRKSTAVVSSEVREPGAGFIPIDYKLYNRHGRWKVYDVKIDNVSLVLNYRRIFGTQIGREGIDGLISRLRKMNARGTQ